MQNCKRLIHLVTTISRKMILFIHRTCIDFNSNIEQKLQNQNHSQNLKLKIQILSQVLVFESLEMLNQLNIQKLNGTQIQVFRKRWLNNYNQKINRQNNKQIEIKLQFIIQHHNQYINILIIQKQIKTKKSNYISKIILQIQDQNIKLMFLKPISNYGDLKKESKK
ncbi:unnamed protein product [Paramecium sonneborni]|uniref:Uncharacterized protein n=1 Tax=Paramecium sonneborni TaxID=65129 RepID=A0A8S1RVA2_9CILI|nr:unnamed protein product [Paramecium sonneborni]